MRIWEIAQIRVRYGYRMIRVLLNREVGRPARTWCTGCTRKKGWGCANGLLGNGVSGECRRVRFARSLLSACRLIFAVPSE